MEIHLPSQIRPTESEYAPFIHNYVKVVVESDVLDAMESQSVRIREIANQISNRDLHTVHPPYQWTIAEVLSHCIDGERVFSYRALRIAAGDQTPLPGFDENAYVAAFGNTAVDLESLVDELIHLRRANLLMFSRFLPDQWGNTGTAGDHTITVRALAFALVGHVRHHFNVIRKRIGITDESLI